MPQGESGQQVSGTHGTVRNGLHRRSVGYVVDFIAFLRHEDQYLGSVDLLTFFQYLVDKGYAPAHHYFAAIELGNEARSGTGELWLKKFEVTQR